jgi:hypothetical protein
MSGYISFEKASLPLLNLAIFIVVYSKAAEK